MNACVLPALVPKHAMPVIHCLTWIACMSAATAFGQRGHAPPSRPTLAFPLPSTEEAKILRTLESLASPKIQSQPLENALNEIEDAIGLEIWVDKASLLDAGIVTDQRVTLNLENIPLQNCLKLLLDPVGLTYVVEDNVLKITTSTRDNPALSARVYPVGDLSGSTEEMTELWQTMECGLGWNPWRTMAPSPGLKTLVVRDSFTGHERVLSLLRHLREAHVKMAQPIEAKASNGRGESSASVHSFPTPTGIEARIISALDALVTVDCKDKPLDAVLQELARQQKFNVWIDEQSFEKEGLEPDLNISLTVKEISLRSCLRLILEPLALTYIIEDDVLKVVTSDTFRSKIKTRIYPIGDLLHFSDNSQELINSLQCALLDVSGKAPTFAVSYCLKTLTVCGNYNVHEQVQTLLRALRDAQQSMKLPANKQME